MEAKDTESKESAFRIESKDTSEVSADSKPCITIYEKKKTMVEQASDFYYCDDTMQRTLQNWCNENCHAFPEGEQLDATYEHSLEHTKLFEEYCALFESLLEKFIVEKLGVTVPQFYAEVMNHGFSMTNICSLVARGMW